MTIRSLFLENTKIYLILIALFGILYLAYSMIIPSIANYLPVILIAIILRDIAFYRRSAQIWPTIKDIIDWDKLESKLSNENSKIK